MMDKLVKQISDIDDLDLGGIDDEIEKSFVSSKTAKSNPTQQKKSENSNNFDNTNLSDKHNNSQDDIDDDLLFKIPLFSNKHNESIHLTSSQIPGSAVGRDRITESITKDNFDLDDEDYFIMTQQICSSTQTNSKDGQFKIPV